MPKEGDIITDKLAGGGTITHEYHAPIAVDAVKELADAKTFAKAEVDAAASEVRARYVTQGLLQQQVYDIKSVEAEAYIAAGYPAKTSAYPVISGEAAITGQTVKQLADLIVATKSAWLSIAGNIEGERIAGKAAIDSAVDIAAVESAKATVLSALGML